MAIALPTMVQRLAVRHQPVQERRRPQGVVSLDLPAGPHGAVLGNLPAISSLVCGAIWLSIDTVKSLLQPLVLIVYQTIDFHHHIVDALIWKLRRKPIQQTDGVAGS